MPKLFLLLAFSFLAPLKTYAVSLSDCYINITISGEVGYFIEKAFDQWKSDPAINAIAFCSEGNDTYPVQITLTGRGLAYGFSSNSKIRLSIVIPVDQFNLITDRNLGLVLTEKRFTLEDVYDQIKFPNFEVHVENTLSEQEIKSVSYASLNIKLAHPNKK